MRKLFIVVLATFASNVFAQEKRAFSIFLSNPTITYSSNSGTNASTGVGVAFDLMLTSRVSAQLSIASERHRSYPYVVDPTNGFINPVTPRTFRIYPIDLAAIYHFRNETRWKPYLGVGARYVSAPNVDSAFRYHSHFNPEIVGGTVFRIGRSFGILVDGKVAFGDREHYDDPFKTSVGVNWRF